MYNKYTECRLCARECGVDRTRGERGFCQSGSEVRIARAALHAWEEPPISATRGSGTIFFVGCSLGCTFCQNREISRTNTKCEQGIPVTPERLSDIMLSIERDGAHNINFVTPTHFAPSVISVTKKARAEGLKIPIVYNTGSYDSLETIRSLDGIVDIYLLDYKFHRESTAKALAHAQNYPEVARAVIREAHAQKPTPIFDANGIMQSGVIVRILLLPGHLAEAKLSVKYLYETYGDSIYISLMNQYTPMPNMQSPLNRRVTRAEYDELVDYALARGVKNAFIQSEGTADESYIPPFNLTNA